MKKGISIIGTGALGSVMARRFAERQFTVQSLYSRSGSTAHAVAEDIGVEQVGMFPSQKEELGEMIFITVPDRHIEETAERLAGIASGFEGCLIAHCSGSKPSAALRPLQEGGAEVASFHPLQTFSAVSSPADFRDIYIDMEGDEKAVALLKEFAKELDCTPMEIEPQAKPYLHAAGVAASNYLVALMEVAGQIAAAGGLDKAESRRALMPLVQKSVANVAKSDTLPDALSGPIARGDASIVADHLKLLEQHPQLSLLYGKLGEVLVQLLEREGGLSDQKIEELSAILGE
jgi:predicted short-subunit dehydrogenase-like oxidoreductase (DUF2520 family)